MYASLVYVQDESLKAKEELRENLLSDDEAGRDCTQYNFILDCDSMDICI
jgi:hypothetical protein